MAKNICLVVFLCLLMVSGCGEGTEEENATGPSLSTSCTELLGLVNGRTLEYLQLDTIITWVPTYQVTEDTSTVTVRITGGSDGWIIHNDTVPVLNLKITDPYAFLNGYWTKLGPNDALVIFTTPAIVVDRTATKGQSWDGFMPVYSSDVGSESYTFLQGCFGFYFTRTYQGTERVLSPAYVGNAHRFEIELFVDEDADTPLATIVEYYAAGFGLVRQEFRAQGLIRILSLRTRY